MKKILAALAAVLVLAILSACTPHQKKEVNDAFRQTDQDVRKIGGEARDHAIRLKAEIMVDHFLEQVIGLNKIGGEARDDLNKAYRDAGAPAKSQDTQKEKK